MTTLAEDTSVTHADLGIVVDTTGSMSGEMNALKANLATIVNALAPTIPNLGITFAGHDDIPNGANGVCTPTPDKAFYRPNGYMIDVSLGGVVSVTNLAVAQAGASGLTLGDGVDVPENQVEALVHAIRGDALSWPAANGCPVGTIASDSGDGVTTFGGVHYRTSALPILVEVSDAPWHNGIRVGSAATSNAYGFAAFTSADLKNAINDTGAHFIGIACSTGSNLDSDIRSPTSDTTPYSYMSYLTDNTNSNVPPSVFGGSCKTGLDGAAVASDGPGGSCRNVYSCRHDGTGIGSAIVESVKGTIAASKYDVFGRAKPTVSESVDAVDAFIQSIVPNPAGGNDSTTGTACATFLAASLADHYAGPKATTVATDGVNDTVKQASQAQKICFDVTPKRNTTVPATTSPQTFHATVELVGAIGTTGSLSLGGTPRTIVFVVPPAPF